MRKCLPARTYRHKKAKLRNYCLFRSNSATFCFGADFCWVNDLYFRGYGDLAVNRQSSALSQGYFLAVLPASDATVLSSPFFYGQVGW